MESFKLLNEVDRPDPRMEMYAIVNKRTGESRPRTLDDHYEAVAKFELSSSVPEDVRSQFNVSKNVLLYAWHSYSFFSVASQHVLSVLELAMKERIGEENIKRIGRGMFRYLDFIIKNEWVKNEDLSAWHRRPFEAAMHEYRLKKSEEMHEKGLKEIELDFREIEVPDENNFDYLGALQETLHKIRNEYAHGTTTLYPYTTYKFFELAEEFINALFDDKNQGEFKSVNPAWVNSV
ncbi:hypothetical protein FE236_02445 [Mariprofundus erugo]|uniref:hypothetical protein n=1 Tax=Mariprofundus erugo TaxID=2528639 RepID=UPI0010FE6D89|nr:hypothetical protein [Mariprofundus erugo]TLS77969.1 hypothetical protein FE236_02445 [Mariprofundus erugo]